MSLLTSEHMVLGILLIDGRTLPTIRAEVNASHFRSEPGRCIFEAACALADEGQDIDPALIRQKAAEQGTALDVDYLMQCMDCAATTSNLQVHLEGMKLEVLRADMMEAVSSANVRLMSGESPQMVCADLQTELQKAVDADNAHRIITSSEATLRFMDHRLQIESGKKKAFIPTGFNALDNALGGGMVPEGLYILAARPGCGKTTLGLQIAENAARRGVRTLFISLEMSIDQLTARRVAVKTGIPSGDILMKNLDFEQCEAMARAVEELSTQPLSFNSVRKASVSSIGILARQVKDCGLVVVDYLGLLQYEQGKNLYEQVTKTSNALKRLACSLGIPILCLAQLNREFEGRKGPPRLSDLRDSGAIEQDADGVLLLHRPPVDLESSYAPALLICTVAKNRHGPMGKEIELNWYLRNGRIRAAVNERVMG